VIHANMGAQCCPWPRAQLEVNPSLFLAHRDLVQLSIDRDKKFLNCLRTSCVVSTVWFPAILVFPYQTAWQYSDDKLLTGASNAGGVGRNSDSEPMPICMASLRAVNAASGQVLSTRRRLTTVPQVVTLIAGSKWRSLLMAGDDTFGTTAD